MKRTALKRSTPLRAKPQYGTPVWLDEARRLAGEGLTPQQVARHLGVPPSNVYRHLQRSGKTCKTCGEYLPRYHVAYCSRDCWPRRQLVDLTCRWCGGSFVREERYASQPNRGLFCCLTCANQARGRLSWCVVCLAEIPAGPPSKPRRTCGFQRCVNEAKAMAKRGKKNPNFAGNEAKTTKWREALGTECTICGVGSPLHLHHVVYKQHLVQAGADVWDPRNALTACVRCHARQHNGSKRIPLEVLTDDNLNYASEALGEYAGDYLRAHYSGMLEAEENGPAALATPRARPTRSESR